MRINALYLAIICIVAALVPHRWAHAEMAAGLDYREPEERLVVGLLTFEETAGWDQHKRPLRDLNMEGSGFETEGLAVLVTGIAAAIACAVASMLVRRRPNLRGARLFLSAPLVATLVATLVFANRLEKFGYLDLGWAPFVCIAGIILGLAGILMPRVSAA